MPVPSLLPSGRLCASALPSPVPPARTSEVHQTRQRARELRLRLSSCRRMPETRVSEQGGYFCYALYFWQNNNNNHNNNKTVKLSHPESNGCSSCYRTAAINKSELPPTEDSGREHAPHPEMTRCQTRDQGSGAFILHLAIRCGLKVASKGT